MLNSRYAPPIALAVVVGLIVGLLGYFLGIRPTLEEATTVFDREKQVRANIEVIRADSAQIDEAAKTLAASDDQSSAIELNAPPVLNLPDFQKRLVASVRSSAVEIDVVSVSSPVLVEPLIVDSTIRPSQALAQRFQSLGLPRQGSEPVDPALTSPVVSPAGDGTAVVDSLYRLEVSFGVKGTPAEVLNFINTLTAPTHRLLLITDVQAVTLQESDLPDIGMGPNADGDLRIRVTGSLFMLDPDLTLVDEDTDIDYVLPADGGLLVPEPIEPQPGANK